MSKFYPRRNKSGMYLNPLWYDNSINPYAGTYGLPNCTCYAYGRFMEAAGKKKCSLPRGNGGAWFAAAQNAGVYKTGKFPALGAVACYGKKGGDGHVAVVEAIADDGGFTISQSGWIPRNQIPAYPPDSPQYFWTNTCSAGSKMPAWMSGKGYYFQGFIYNPDSGGRPVKPEWIKGNRWLNQAEMENNAMLVWDHFRRAGWTENACAAVLGNMQVESKVNPGIWENLTVNPSGGFGLVQWTPSTKLTNWIRENYPGKPLDDGDIQLDRIQYEKANGLQWGTGGVPAPYKMSFGEFSQSTADLKTLTGAWMLCYEKPADQSDSAIRTRTKYSEKWFEMFTGRVPPSLFPAWLLMILTKRR